MYNLYTTRAYNQGEKDALRKILGSVPTGQKVIPVTLTAGAAKAAVRDFTTKLTNVLPALYAIQETTDAEDKETVRAASVNYQPAPTDDKANPKASPVDADFLFTTLTGIALQFMGSEDDGTDSVCPEEVKALHSAATLYMAQQTRIKDLGSLGKSSRKAKSSHETAYANNAAYAQAYDAYRAEKAASNGQG